MKWPNHMEMNWNFPYIQILFSLYPNHIRTMPISSHLPKEKKKERKEHLGELYYIVNHRAYTVTDKYHDFLNQSSTTSSGDTFIESTHPFSNTALHPIINTVHGSVL